MDRMNDKRLFRSFIVRSVYLCSQEGREGGRKERMKEAVCQE